MEWKELYEITDEVFENEKKCADIYYLYDDLEALADEVDDSLSNRDVVSLIGNIDKAGLDDEALEDIAYEIRKTLSKYVVLPKLKELYRKCI